MVRTLALLDSGADDCIFPASLAGPLGITIPNQNSYIFSGSGQASQVAFFENVEVAIWDYRSRTPVTVFGLYAGFCETMEHTGLGLLGQVGFFSKFKVTFDHADGYFEIEDNPTSV
jgi:hypothetical protein